MRGATSNKGPTPQEVRDWNEKGNPIYQAIFLINTHPKWAAENDLRREDPRLVEKMKRVLEREERRTPRKAEKKLSREPIFSFEETTETAEPRELKEEKKIRRVERVEPRKKPVSPSPKRPEKKEAKREAKEVKEWKFDPLAGRTQGAVAVEDIAFDIPADIPLPPADIPLPPGESGEETKEEAKLTRNWDEISDLNPEFQYDPRWEDQYRRAKEELRGDAKEATRELLTDFNANVDCQAAYIEYAIRHGQGIPDSKALKQAEVFRTPSKKCFHLITMLKVWENKLAIWSASAGRTLAQYPLDPILNTEVPPPIITTMIQMARKNLTDWNVEEQCPTLVKLAKSDIIRPVYLYIRTCMLLEKAYRDLPDLPPGHYVRRELQMRRGLDRLYEKYLPEATTEERVEAERLPEKCDFSYTIAAQSFLVLYLLHHQTALIYGPMTMVGNVVRFPEIHWLALVGSLDEVIRAREQLTGQLELLSRELSKVENERDAKREKVESNRELKPFQRQRQIQAINQEYEPALQKANEAKEKVRRQQRLLLQQWLALTARNPPPPYPVSVVRENMARWLQQPSQQENLQELFRRTNPDLDPFTAKKSHEAFESRLSQWLSDVYRSLRPSHVSEDEWNRFLSDVAEQKPDALPMLQAVGLPSLADFRLDPATKTTALDWFQKRFEGQYPKIIQRVLPPAGGRAGASLADQLLGVKLRRRS